MRRVVLASIPTLLLASMTARAEMLVRWRQGDLPPREVLGVQTVVVSADGSLVPDALGKGYRVYLHSDPARVSAVAATARASGAAGVAVVGSGPIPKDLPVPAIQVDDSGKWPRIRSNVRGRRSQVVQAANRTGQPWLDNNVAQVRILQAAGRRAPSPGRCPGLC